MENKKCLKPPTSIGMKMLKKVNVVASGNLTWQPKIFFEVDLSWEILVG